MGRWEGEGGREAGAESRVRSCSVSRKPGSQGRGLKGGWGRGFPGPLPPPPPRIVQLAGPRAGEPWTGVLPGMVSKALLRLVSAVNRRRMKLLLGIALLAYLACECAPGCQRGSLIHYPAPRRRGRGAAGSLRPRGALQPGLPPRLDGTCAFFSHHFPGASDPSHHFHFCGKAPGQLGRRPSTA